MKFGGHLENFGQLRVVIDSIEFLDPENMGVDIKIVLVGASMAKFKF